jgi:formyltetrahydrofolate-dependent phosphoribosylglycinamide formyltransferase
VTEHSYANAGVSLVTAGSVVDRLRAAVESTGVQGFGAFAGLHPLGDGRFLAASTDGVGTKLILARQRGRLRDCGADLAAHCINDVATCGAEPLMLLDYVAANTIELDDVAELVEGAAAVCRDAGVALVGGETAELPGIYADGELDFAGTCVGVVDEPLTGASIEAGIATATFSLDCHESREERDLVMATWLEEHGVELVVLAGYMHLLTEPFLRRFPERIVNVHPSLLPAFPGAHAIRDAIAAGADPTGVTVHYVDEGLDSGPVLAQQPVPLEPRATLEDRIHAVEHELLPRVVRELCPAP